MAKFRLSNLDIESCNSAQRIVWLMWGYTWRNISELSSLHRSRNKQLLHYFRPFHKKKKDLLNPRLHMLSKNQWLCLKLFCLFDDILKKLLSFLDNTAGIVTKRSGFRRRLQEIYFLPVVIEDNGYPPKSSTGTLTIRVCGCESDGSLLTCSAEAIFLPVGLSTGALIAILLCIIILLGEIRILFSNFWKLQTVWNMTIFMAVIVSSHFLCGKYFMGFQEDKS